jgi:hypothetical protein
MKKTLRHTKHDEAGFPVYTIGELAEASLPYVISRRTGESPEFIAYRETMRKKIRDSLPGNIHRHDNNRIVRNESRVTVDNWIETHRSFGTGKSVYRCNIDGMEQNLRLALGQADGSSFTHHPSQNEIMSARAGQTYGPNNTEPFSLTEYLPSLSGYTTVDPKPSTKSYTTAEFSFIDYDKTDQIRRLLSEVFKMIGKGKSDGELDEILADNCYAELMLGLGSIGGVK